MPVNHFLVGSLTSVLVANAPPMPLSQPSTLTDRPPWIETAVTTPPIREGQVAALNAAETALPDWKSALLANAKSVAALEAGWDGPGSTPISKSVLARAAFYAESALDGAAADFAAPRLVPGGDGGLQIEWHTRRGEIELELDTEGRASIWIRNHLSGAEFDGEGEEALTLFYRWAPWVAARLRHGADVSAAAQMVSFEVAA